jgi:TetR/AcrR family transcriptional repressor of nem operon
MSAKSEQKQQTHQAILDSAARIVRERGIAGASVADVMAGARLTVGGFYAHFGSKAAMVDEAMKGMFAKMRASLFGGLDAKPAADRGIVLIKRYLSPAHRDLKTEGCPMPAIVGEVATRSPEHRDALRGEVETILENIERTLAPGPLSKRHVAIAALALMYGGLGLSRAMRGTELSDEVLKACRAVGSWVVTAGRRTS